MEKDEPQGRVNPTNQGPVSPARFFCEWNSTEKCFTYYDKATKKNVLLPLPFTFLPLHEGYCIKGYSDPEKTSYVSNEVKIGDSDSLLIVRAYNNLTKKNHVAMVGTYANIQDKIKSILGKSGFSRSFYIAIKGADEKMFIANLQINGSGATHWKEFAKTTNIWSNAVQVKEFSNEKKGSNKYTAPVFNAVKIKPESDAEAAILQKEVLAYLEPYHAKNAAEAARLMPATGSESKPSKPAEKAFDNSKHKDAQTSEVIIEDNGADISFADEEAPDVF